MKAAIAIERSIVAAREENSSVARVLWVSAFRRPQANRHSDRAGVRAVIHRVFTDAEDTDRAHQLAEGFCQDTDGRNRR